MIRIAFITLAIGYVLAGCATDRSLVDSKARWHPRETYLQSIDTPTLQSLVDQGDMEAQFHLAIRLMSGDRIERNEAQAASMAREAALEGDPRAQYLFGAALSGGLGVEANDSEAARWFERSAQKGYVTAEYWHGFMLSRGRGYDVADWREAMKWIRRAAEKGHIDAQFTLGEAYHACRGGLPRDFEKAASWYRKAYDRGDGSPLARENLMRLIDSGLIEWIDGDPGAPPISFSPVDSAWLEPCS